MNTNKTPNRLLSVALGTLSTVAIAFPATSTANDLTPAATQPTAARSLDAGTDARKPGYESNVYIIQLEDAPVATYMGGIQGLPATANRATGANKLDTNSKASKKYKAHLKQKQKKFLDESQDTIGRSVDVDFDYQIVLNAVAAELSEAEADALRSMPGVKAVVRERYEVPLTDVGPEWINAPDILSGPPNNLPHSTGEGIVIAVLDTGINSDHPSFADIGGDGETTYTLTAPDTPCDACGGQVFIAGSTDGACGTILWWSSPRTTARSCGTSAESATVTPAGSRWWRCR